MYDTQKAIEDVRTDPQLLAERWAGLDALGQIELLNNITLSQELVALNWDVIGDEEDRNQFRFLCCKHQQIDSEFLIAHWSDLEVDSKYAAMLEQEQLPAELVKDFWEGLKSQTGDHSIVKAFAGTVPPERQPEGFVPDEEDVEEEATDTTCEPEEASDDC